MRSTLVAYLLWFFGGFGVLGLHRFYLGMYGTGILWFFTGGLAMVGAITDFFRLPHLVQHSNLSLQYHQAIFGQSAPPPPVLPLKPKESVERIILRAAQKNQGVITPGQVALEGDIPIDEAKKALEKLVTQGFAEMKVRSSGVIVYVFHEFLPDDGTMVDI